jgi:hypothetical protein
MTVFLLAVQREVRCVEVQPNLFRRLRVFKDEGVDKQPLQSFRVDGDLVVSR